MEIQLKAQTTDTKSFTDEDVMHMLKRARSLKSHSHRQTWKTVLMIYKPDQSLNN